MEKMKNILHSALGKLKSFRTQHPVQSVQTDAPSEDFVALCRKLAELVKMYDQMAKQMPVGETKDLAEDISEQIITTLSLTKGCSPIINEPVFNSRRHTPVPFSMVEDGTPIQSFLRIGIAIDDQVIIPAKVKL